MAWWDFDISGFIEDTTRQVGDWWQGITGSMPQQGPPQDTGMSWEQYSAQDQASAAYMGLQPQQRTELPQWPTEGPWAWTGEWPGYVGETVIPDIQKQYGEAWGKPRNAFDKIMATLKWMGVGGEAVARPIMARAWAGGKAVKLLATSPALFEFIPQVQGKDSEETYQWFRDRPEKFRELQDIVGRFDEPLETTVERYREEAPWWLELLGEIFLDPLTYVNPGFIGKAQKSLRMAKVTKPVSELNFLERLFLRVPKTAAGEVLPAEKLGLRGSTFWQETLERLPLPIPTRLSRSIRLAERAYDNIAQRLGATGDNVPEMAEFLRKFRDAPAELEKAGLPGIMSQEGQQVSRMLAGYDPDLVFKTWEAGENARRILGEAGPLDDVIKAIDAGEIVDAPLVAAREALKGAPQNANELAARLASSVHDHVSEATAKTLGVSEKQFGLIKFSNWLKAKESVLLLELNPLYPVYNVVTDAGTRMWDGTFGAKTIRQASDELASKVGVLPKRFTQGIGMGGPRKGWGFAKLAQKAESWASANAFNQGFKKAWSQVWPKSRGKMPPELAVRMSAIDPDLPRLVEAAVDAGFSADDIAKKVFSPNLEKNIYAYVDEVAEMMGKDPASVRNMLMTDDLGELIQKGINEGKSSWAIKDDLVRGMTRDRAGKKELAENLEKLKAEGGPFGFLKIMDDMDNARHGRFIDQAAELDEFHDALRVAVGPERKQLVKEFRAYQNSMWADIFDGEKRALDAIYDSLADVGIKTPGRFRQLMRGLRDSVAATRKQHDAAWDAFWDADFTEEGLLETHRLLDDLWGKQWTEQAARRKEAARILLDSLGGGPPVARVVGKTPLNKPVVGEADKFYRGFDDVAEAIGPDVSMQRSEPFLWGGAYEIEFPSPTGITVPHRPDTMRGAFRPEKVTRVFFEPRAIAPEFMESQLAQDLPKLRETFPNAEFVQVRLADDAETRVAVAISQRYERYLFGAEDIARGADDYMRQYSGMIDEDVGTVQAFVKEARQLPYNQRRQAWQQFWAARNDKWAQNITQLSEARGALVTDDVTSRWAGVADALDNAEPPESLILREGMSREIGPMVDALDTVSKGRVAGKAVPAEMTGDVQKYLDSVQPALSEARNAAVMNAEAARDFALLNYSWRTGFNTWLGVMSPYEFWASTTLRNWAIRSIDNPGMLAAYVKYKQSIDEKGVPSRLQQMMRVHLPFLPDWMGDAFVDPISRFLPIGQFLGAAKMMSYKDEYSRRKENLEYAQQQGASPEEIEELQGLLQETKPQTGFDMMSYMFGPHLPLSIAYLMAQGRGKDIGMLPPTRAIRHLSTGLKAAGVEGIPPGGVNIEAPIRRGLQTMFPGAGVTVEEGWDPYRIDRMLSNMAADGTITEEDARLAMIERKGPDFEEAQRRASQESAMGYLPGFAGARGAIYPAGEERQREIRDIYQDVVKSAEAGDEKAYQEFYDEYPEYRARQALFQAPVKRNRRYLRDAIWATYMESSSLEKRVIRDTLGDKFQEFFLDRETRDYDKVPQAQMQKWLEQMGGRAPEREVPEEKMGLPSEAASEAYEDWKGIVETEFGGDEIYATQSEYYALPTEQRKAFREAHPELVEYWERRRAFLAKNPAVAKILASPEKETQAWTTSPSFQRYERRAFGGRGGYTLDTFQESVGLEISQAAIQYFTTGKALTPAARNRLMKEFKKNKMGFQTLEEWLAWMRKLWVWAKRVPGFYTTQPGQQQDYAPRQITARKHMGWG